ncbi:MAG: TetR family transcriptional regulator C-terminal domain-containing protein [Bacteroidota bacterium]
MPTKKSAPELTAQDLILKYTQYILDKEQVPGSVYKFCESIGIEESEFYKFYASFETLEAAFFEALHNQVLSLLNNHKDYDSYDDANKLLSYYFTFFEMATANRSYILLSLKNEKNPMQSYQKLGAIRAHFLAFANSVLENSYKLPNEQLKKIEAKLLQEGAWLQFILTFKFWMKDSSPNFEKTDLLIEKSVKASFEILEAFPVESILDLGKFLWKERPFQ